MRQLTEEARAKAAERKQGAQDVDGLMTFLEKNTLADRDRLDQMESRLEAMPVSLRNNYCRSATGKSRKAAIKAFCCECMGYALQDVDGCTDLGCPLYPYRPK